MNIEQIAIEVADELFLDGMAVGHNPAEFLRRCLKKLAEHVDLDPFGHYVDGGFYVNSGDGPYKWRERKKYIGPIYTETQLIAAQQKAAEACAEYLIKGNHPDELVASKGMIAGDWRYYL